MKETFQNLKNLMSQILSRAGFQVEVEDFSTNKELKLNLKTQEKLILKNTKELIPAFQELCRRLLDMQETSTDKGVEEKERTRVFFDIQGERQKREEKLRELAQAAARKVRREKKDLELPPMNSFERRIIHFEISLFPDLTSGSVGDGPERRVVIKLNPLEKPESTKGASATGNQAGQENGRVSLP